MSRNLDVYLHGILAGQLIQANSGGLSFIYNEAYTANNHPAISLALPLQNDPFIGDVVKAFFSGLLPEAMVRHRLAQYLRVSEKNAFALLEVIGGECAGALSLQPESTKLLERTQDDIEILDDRKLIEILDLLKRRPLLAGSDNLRLSLAGAQDKIAVGVVGSKIALFRGATPTTHILKPVITEIEDSVHNELFCMQLAKLVGIMVPSVEIRYVDDMPYYLVERYDRVPDATGQLQRLHQEDFCQALGIMPELKYENEGGPSIARCQQILQNYSTQPEADQINLLKYIIFNYLIGNNDAHGKNFALLYKSRKPILAPAYDLLSTVVYSDFSTKMAMKIGNKYQADEVLLWHWQRLVPDTKLAKDNLHNLLITMAKTCLEQAQILQTRFASMGIQSPIFAKINLVIAKRANRLSNI